MPSENNDRDLGHLEGIVERLVGEIASIRQRSEDTYLLTLSHGSKLDRHAADDLAIQSELRNMMSGVKATVERISKPVDTFISVRNVILGLAALLAAIGAVVQFIPMWIWGYFASLFR